MTGQGNIKFSVYKQYIKSGKFWFFILYVILLIGAQGVNQYSSVLITHWTIDKYGWTLQDKGSSESSDAGYDAVISQMIQKYGDKAYVISKTQQCYYTYHNQLDKI